MRRFLHAVRLALAVAAIPSLVLLAPRTALAAVGTGESDPYTPSASAIVVAVDAGHGSVLGDPGATGNGLQESTLTATIADGLASELAQYGDISVVKTRPAINNLGQTRDLIARTETAKNAGANLFVSVHINSAKSTAAKGVEVHIPNTSSYNYYCRTTGESVGKKVLNSLLGFGLSNRGLIARNYSESINSDTTYPDGSPMDYLSVIRNSRLRGMPAILVEHGFISNSHDVAILSNTSTLLKMGAAEADAIASYYEVTKGVAVPHFYVTDMSTGRIDIAWDSTGADKYAIYIRADDTEDWQPYSEEYTGTTMSLASLPDGTPLENGKTYQILVQGNKAGKWSSVDDGARWITLTPSPANVTAAPSGDGQVTLTWGAVDGADAYAVAELVDGGWHTYTTTCAETSYTVSDLANGVSHSFLVQARVGGRWSRVSEGLCASATPTGTVKPSATATAGPDSVKLSWGRVPGAERYAVAVMQDGGWHTYTYDCADESYEVTGLSDGEAYTFLVQSYAAGRWSAFDESDYVSATAGGTSPANVTAAPSGDGQVTLTWGAVDGADAYAVAELVDGGWHTYTTTCAETSYTVSDLANGVSHSFLVQARVGGRWSRVSEGLCASATPTGTVKPSATATAGPDSVKLSWGRVPGAERYAVAVMQDGGWHTYTYDCADESYEVTGLSDGEAYTFLVQSYAAGRWSAFDESDYVSATAGGTSPANVTAAPSGDGQVTLTWGAVDGADAYAVAELVDGGWHTYTTTCAETSYTVSDLANGVSHSFLVQARVGGRWSRVSEGLCASATPTGTVKPSATATAGPDSVKLSWGRVPGAERYAVAVMQDGGWHTYTYDCADESYEVTGLSDGEAYTFLVQSYAAGRWSAFDESDYVSATTKHLIMGAQRVSASAMVANFKRSGNSYPSDVYSSKGAATIEEFVSLLCEVASSEGVRPEVLYAQAMLETGYLQFGGAVKAEQCNFGGLGAVDSSPTDANTFSDVRTGLLAQAQHLKGYASTDDLNNECVDVRFKYVSRGVAPFVEDLGGGKWASSQYYGTNVIRILDQL